MPLDRLPIEAALDPRRLIARDPRSRVKEAVRVLGRSPGLGRVLVVLLLPDGHPPAGRWHVATAWPANRAMRILYDCQDEEDG
jgi:hypothetical protein